MSKNTKVGENGYFIVTDEKGTIIASGKDESLVSKSIKELKVENLNDLSKYKNSSFSTKMGNGKEYFINVKNPLMKIRMVLHIFCRKSRAYKICK